MRTNKMRHSIHRQFLAAAITSVAALASSSAMAGIVCGPATNISIPNTFSGVYINFLTGVTGATPASAPGWDFGPWGSSSVLSFFWNSAPANSNSGVASTTSGPYLALTAGTPVGPSSTFSASAQSGQVTAFQSGGTNMFGFRFFNENTSTINYGWGELNTTGPQGFPATLVRYCYQNDGTEILAGTTPVSLQSYSVE